MATARSIQKEETRRELFEIALAEIRQHGLAEASIDTIAQKASVSRGTFYFHFPAKEHVLAELLRGAKQRVARVIDELPARTKVAQVLSAVCQATVEEWRDEPRLFLEAGLLGVRLAGEGKDTRESDPVRRALSARFEHAKELKSPLGPELLADMFLLEVLIAGMAWSANPSLDFSSVLGAVTHLFLRGVQR
jgi:AcrR family transcriptional regulator